MRKFHKISIIAAVFGIALFATSCKDDKGKEIVSEVKFDQEPPFEIEVGKTLTVTAKITPASLVNKTEYTLTSNAPAVATATESVSGSKVAVVVTGHSPGDARITLAVKGFNVSDFIDVTVKPQAGDLTVEVSGAYTWKSCP